MTWLFVDGTALHLGGAVDGDSAFAIWLRLLLEHHRQTPCVWVSPLLRGSDLLDVSNPLHLHALARDALMPLSTTPEFEAIPVSTLPEDCIP